MAIRVNGTPAKSLAGKSLADLVIQAGAQGKRVAIEVNGLIVPQAAWEETRLKDGDQVEMISFVGGG